MAFWRFGFQQASPIDTLLEKENLTLEELYEEDDLLQEVKTHNKRVVSFLIREENMTKLLKYVVQSEEMNAAALAAENEQSSSTAEETNAASDDAGPSGEDINADEEQEEKSGKGIEVGEEAQEGQEAAEDSVVEENKDAEENSATTEESTETEPTNAEGDEAAETEADEDAIVEAGEEGEDEAVVVEAAQVVVSPEQLKKYSYLSAEIIKCEVWSILDTIIRNDDHLDLLLSFLDQPVPLNEAHANYCCAVLTILLNKKPYLLAAKCQGTDNIIDKLVTHFGTYSVMDFTIRLVICEDYSSEWMFEDELCSKLVQGLTISDDSPDLVENATQALNEIVLFGTQVASSAQPIILEQFQDVDFVDSLVEALLLDHCLQPGLKVLDSLARNTINDFPEAQDPLEESPAVIQAIVKRFARLHEVLMLPSPMATMKTTFGVLTPPLGSQRLEVIEFFLNLFRTHFHVVDEQLIKYNVMPTLLDLFFQYEWNNALHLKVAGMVEEVLEGENCDDLRSALMTQCKLLDRLLEGVEKNQEATKKGPGFSLGYMGFITNMSKMVMNACTQHQIVAEAVDKHDPWLVYADTMLRERTEEEEKPLGGHKPLNDHEEDLFGSEMTPASDFQKQFETFANSMNDDDDTEPQIIDDSDDFAENDDEDDEIINDDSWGQSGDGDILFSNDVQGFEEMTGNRASAYQVTDDGFANADFGQPVDQEDFGNFANFDAFDDTDNVMTMSPQQKDLLAEGGSSMEVVDGSVGFPEEDDDDSMKVNREDIFNEIEAVEAEEEEDETE